MLVWVESFSQCVANFKSKKFDSAARSFRVFHTYSNYTAFNLHLNEAFLYKIHQHTFKKKISKTKKILQSDSRLFPWHLLCMLWDQFLDVNLLMPFKNVLHVFLNRSCHPDCLAMTYSCPAIFDISSVHTQMMRVWLLSIVSK